MMNMIDLLMYKLMKYFKEIIYTYMQYFSIYILRLVQFGCFCAESIILSFFSIK